MTNGQLLWVDDEIELLKAHILFLKKKGYEVTTVSNGTVTMRKSGKAVITATSENGLTASCTVTVIAQKHFLAVQPDQLTVGAGKTGTLLCQVAVVGSWQPFARQRKVTTCSRVQVLLGLNLVLLVPAVICGT